MAPENPRRFLGTVCVLGGGIAGLLAARVLADHADRVLIIERDGPSVADGTQRRPGVPQGYQVHGLLPGGRAQLERFFPGIVAQAVAEGAVHCRPERTATYVDGVEQIVTPNTDLVTFSRPFLEALVRRRVLALDNVVHVTGQVAGLLYEEGAVKAVRWRTASAGEHIQPADFVVDATGRASRLANWLARDGWESPLMERIPVDIRYLTARFSRATDWRGPLNGVFRHSPAFASGGLAGAAVNAIEHDQWALMLAFFGSETGEPTTEDFAAWCRALPEIFQEAVKGRPLGEVRPYRHADSRWRHFERLERFPARLAVVGDAVASFNPVYGQGMSSAALHASCLSAYLCADPDPDVPAREFLAAQRVVVEAAWQTSTAADAVRLGLAPAPATDAERARGWAVRQVTAASATDVEVATRLRAVAFMTEHPASLTDRDLVLRAACANRVPESEYPQSYR
ncbi:FAD-dependent oxidoreductase [Streptomyces chartreusis]